MKNNMAQNNDTKYKNAFGQAIGEMVTAWHAPAPVQTAALTKRLQGKHCYLEPLEENHSDELRTAFSHASPRLWTYLPYGPFESDDDYLGWIKRLNAQDRKNSFAYCIRSADDDHVLGVSAYLRINPEAGSIEIGHLSFSPLLQQTTAATETLFMMIDAVFMLGYRRCEWKCNSLNQPSIASAKRLGFTYEGTFRHAQVVKGANRDTAWFSIIDSEWPMLKQRFESWLDDDNFDSSGKQKKRLVEFPLP